LQKKRDKGKVENFIDYPQEASLKEDGISNPVVKDIG